MTRRKLPPAPATVPAAPRFQLLRGPRQDRIPREAATQARQASPQPGEHTAEEYQKTTLENGIRVVTERMSQARSVSLGVLVAAGPRDETIEHCGLAHLCEHLMFRGTSSRDALDIARVMDGAGGHLGGFTTRDYTCYFATVLDDYCTFGLDLFGDLLLNSTYPAALLESERQAILHEIRGLQDDPQQRVHAMLKARAWRGHALGRPVAGRAESLARLTREDVIYFVQRHYTPDRMIVAAAGNLAHDDFVASVRDSFWRLLGRDMARPAAAPRFGGGLSVEEGDLAQAYFALGIPAPPFDHPDRYGVHVLCQILGGGVSSRLFRRLREEQGLVYDIGAEYQAFADGGMLVVEGSCEPPQVLRVLAYTLREVARLLGGEERPDAEEVARAGAQLRGRHLIAADDPHTRMSRLDTQEIYFGRALGTATVVSQLAAVDLPALDRVSRALLAASRMKAAAALLGPRLSAGTVAAARSMLNDFSR